MIIYMKCTCTSVEKLRAKAWRDEGHEVRLANSKWRKEAKLYNLRLPFKVIDEEKKIGEPL